MDKKHFDDARIMIASALADFLIHLMTLPNPLVVGGGYSKDKLLAEYRIWAASRQFNVEDLDPPVWEVLWKSGVLK